MNRPTFRDIVKKLDYVYADTQAWINSYDIFLISYVNGTYI